MQKTTPIIALICLLAVAPASWMQGGGEIPGAKQTQPVVLKNGTVHTVSGSVIVNATVVFEGGRITQVGTRVVEPANSIVVDCSGKHVYPGFISANAQIGLSEIDAVRSTRDASEVGQWNPNVKASVAYNPDSEIIPTVRYNGVLLANIAPQGGSVSGMSAVMRMDGWTREDLTVKENSACVVNWPRLDVIKAWWMKTPEDEQRKEIANRGQQFHAFFRDAHAYYLLTINGADTSKKDARFESMKDVFSKKIPLLISAQSRQQIESALDFAREFDVRIILATGTDVIPCLEQVKKQGVPLLLSKVHSLPSRDEDKYDTPFTLAAKVEAAGIKYAITEDGAWQQRNLPFEAGTAVAYGLDQEKAVRAISLSVAEIFGIDNDYGSLDVGKSATLFVSNGVAIDALTCMVEHAYIDGRKVDLNTRHTKLSTKYMERLNR